MGENHISESDQPEYLADVSHQIADYFNRIGDTANVEAFAKRAIAYEEKADRTALLANHIMFFATLLIDQQRYEEALKLAAQGYERYRRDYGEDHGETRYALSVVNRLRQLLDDLRDAT